MSIKGKRLLFLGGALYQVPALECAKKNGCFVILVDQEEAVPGRPYADLFEKISTTDAQAIVALGRKHKVDGVMTYASDSSTRSVAFVSQALGLAGSPEEAALTLQRKDLFRELQKKEGLPHPSFFIAENPKEVSVGLKGMAYPIVVKPVDSSGTKGQSVIYSENGASYALNYAKRFSQLGKAIFETFVSTDTLELDGDVLVRNGKVVFRHYGHNYFLKDYTFNVPCGEIFPGFFGPKTVKDLDRQFQAIVDALGIRDGCMNFDGFLSKGKVYIIDIALRNGGNYVPELIRLSTGFDLTEAAIYGALGMPYPVPSFKKAKAKPVASYLIASRVEGKLEKVEFDPQIKKHLITMRPFSEAGSPVYSYTRSDHAVGIAFFRFSDMKQLKEKMERIEDLVRVKLDAVQTVAASHPHHTKEKSAYRQFPELISPFLREKLKQAEKDKDETVLRVLSRQYLASSKEFDMSDTERPKHYEAAAGEDFEGGKVIGVERLYRRVAVFEPLYQCISHCRFCLRRYYEKFQHDRESLERAARFIGKGKGSKELREILVTGGDPFLVPDKVKIFFEAIAKEAPQIEVIRLATRLPVHYPERVGEAILAVLRKKYPFRIEVATQVNHASEIFPEVEASYRKILDTVRIIYNQTVLLAGVNDTFEELIELFDRLRQIGIENHYLFHCVPMFGMSHFRTSLKKSLELVSRVSASGLISGRTKPKFALMTDVGKIVLYEGTILEQNNGRYLLKSHYRYEERLKWNPHWKLPPNAVVDKDGILCVWYEDGTE